MNLVRWTMSLTLVALLSLLTGCDALLGPGWRATNAGLPTPPFSKVNVLVVDDGDARDISLNFQLTFTDPAWYDYLSSSLYVRSTTEVESNKDGQLLTLGDRLVDTSGNLVGITASLRDLGPRSETVNYTTLNLGSYTLTSAGLFGSDASSVETYVNDAVLYGTGGRNDTVGRLYSAATESLEATQQPSAGVKSPLGGFDIATGYSDSFVDSTGKIKVKLATTQSPFLTKVTELYFDFYSPGGTFIEEYQLSEADVETLKTSSELVVQPTATSIANNLVNSSASAWTVSVVVVWDQYPLDDERVVYLYAKSEQLGYNSWVTLGSDAARPLSTLPKSAITEGAREAAKLGHWNRFLRH